MYRGIRDCSFVICYVHCIITHVLCHLRGQYSQTCFLKFIQSANEKTWSWAYAGSSTTKRYNMHICDKLIYYLYLKAELFFGKSGLLRRPWHNAASIRLHRIATRGWLSVASSARPPNRIWHCFTASRSSDSNLWRSSALEVSSGEPGTSADIIVATYTNNAAVPNVYDEYSSTS